MDDFGRLTELVPGRIWTKRAPLTFFGLQMGTRMTVIRMRNGQLFLHSPVALDAELERDLEGLGPVHFVIGPNRLHHLFLGDYVRAFPQAHLYGSRALPKKRPDVPFHGVLEDEAEPDWADEIDQVVVRGSTYLDEVVFFDRDSGVLIVTDLLQHATAEDHWFYRAAARLVDSYGRPAVTRDLRWLLHDHPALRASVQRILQWPFDRIIMAHGPPVLAGGKQIVRDAFGWL